MKHCATMRPLAIVVGVLLALVVAGGMETYAQDLRSEERDRLAPRLRVLATGEEEVDRLSPLVKPLRSETQPGEGTAESEQYSVVIYTSDPGTLRENGIRVHSELGDLVTAHVTAADLRSLARLESVRYVEPSRRYEPMNDVARGGIGAVPLHEGTLGTSYTGKDVLACVIDTGIDWAHEDFREVEDPTSSRIYAIWDQTLRPGPGEETPTEFDYGVEYSRRDIERELRGSTDGSVRHKDEDGHGTHVAGTLAGNGAASPNQRYRGVAPEADLLVVKTDFVNLIDGMSYCGQVAEEEGRPLVVNMSLGRSAGPHDGTAPVARAIDNFVETGRAVVAAAGNGGNKGQHTSRTLPPGEEESVRIEVPSYTPEDGPGNDVAFSFDSWTSGESPLSVEVITPNDDTVALASDTAAVITTREGGLAYENTVHPGNGDRNIELTVFDADAEVNPARGTWTLLLRNETSEATTVHGWMARTSMGSEIVGGDNAYTVAPPATAQKSVSVGAWTQRWRWQDANGNSWAAEDFSDETDRTGAIAQFSSRGSLRGGGEKPDLSAPGHRTASSLSHDATLPPRLTLSEGPYAVLQGTSMASAAAAGAVALLFEHEPSLTGDRVRQLLIDNARADAYVGSSWNETWGHGKLDVFQAMADLQDKPVRARRQIAYDDPSSNGALSAHTLGGEGAERMAVRFTPEESGRLLGLSLHTADGNANRLSDPLIAEIWTDNEGRPGSPLGMPVSVPPEALSNHSFAFVSLGAADVTVDEGTDYHVVLSPRSSSDELDIAGEEVSVDGRSSMYTNGSWTSLQEADLAVRVTTGIALDLDAPPIPKATEGTLIRDSDDPSLDWQGVPDAEQYSVQISTEAEFPEEATRTLTVEGTSQTLEDVPSSTSYHWRVRAEGQGHTGPWSRPQSFLYYPTSIDVRVTRSFGTAEGSSGYRLVALPGERNTSIASTFEGANGTDWRAFWDNGDDENYLVEVDESSSHHFRPGNGFWLIGEEDWSVDGSVSSVPLREDGTYALDLHEGWNIISNPFDLEVSWSAVEAANDGSLQPPWRFDGSFRQASTLTSAQEGEAFYFLNDQGLDELVLPYPEAPNAPRGDQTSEEGSTLTLTTIQDGQRTSVVQAGLAPDAEEGIDARDQVAPPADFDQASLRLDAPTEEAPPRRRELAAEYRPAEVDGHTFSLTLDAEPGIPVEIEVEGSQAFDGQRVVLVNSATAQTYDLQTTPTVTLHPESETQSLQLLIGSPSYVETQKEVALPTEIQFPPSYPNPFEEQTTLEYTLPEPASVRLAVYDVLGRPVDVLVDDRQQAGVHTVQWDGRNEDGRRVASGLYLARLVVDGTSKVRKMTLVR